MEEMDWANLNRYKDDNLKLKSPSSEENRIVFFGDSITEQWVDIVPDFFTQNNYIGRGIGGQTTPQMLLRFRNDVIKLKPKIVHILAGTNDIAGNSGPVTLEMILDNIISMAELAKTNNIKVVLASILPALDYPWIEGIKPAEKIIELNNMIKDYADKNNLLYIDYHSLMANEQNGMKEKYTTDGVHVTELGYQEIMIPTVKQNL